MTVVSVRPSVCLFVCLSVYLSDSTHSQASCSIPDHYTSVAGSQEHLTHGEVSRIDLRLPHMTQAAMHDLSLLMCTSMTASLQDTETRFVSFSMYANIHTCTSVAVASINTAKLPEQHLSRANVT